MKQYNKLHSPEKHGSIAKVALRRTTRSTGSVRGPGTVRGAVVGNRCSGAALILALAMLVLLSGMVLAYMVTVRTEFNAAKAYEGGIDVRLVADSAMNRLLGQLREATTQPDVTWISQPGLIRTFGTDGSPDKSYKLYSADSLIEKGSFDPALGTDLPGANPAETSAAPADVNFWKKQPSLWTDLNQPVADRARTNPFDDTQPMMVYPIFDGNHLKMATDLTLGPGKKSLQLSLNDDGAADVEGFKVTDKYSDGGASMPVKWLYMLKDGTLVPAKASGTGGDVEVVVPADKQKTAQGDFNGVVARVAFWTDDESAKVNVNTASEGTYWDSPSGASQPGKPTWSNPASGTAYNPVHNSIKPAGLITYIKPYVKDLPKNGASLTPAAAAGVKFVPNDATFEWEYMHMTPGQREYQRYTGHPATTCLSTVFGRQLKLRIEPAIEDPAKGPKLEWQTRALMCEEIYKMIPRVTGLQYDKTIDPAASANVPFPADPRSPAPLGPLVPKDSTTYPGRQIAKDYTSRAGTQRPTVGEILGKPLPGIGTKPGDPGPGPVLTPDTDRLYASVDEFLYNPNFYNPVNPTDMTEKDLRRNAWELAPKDTAGERDRTREMLEMSKFFLTANSKAPEQNLFNLPRISIWPLRTITGPTDKKRTALDKVFAFCSSLGDKTSDDQFYFTRNDNAAPTGPTDDYQSIKRNQDLITYLKDLTSKQVPGWKLNGATSSTIAGKYGADHEQILAEIFDYIRCTNLCDMSEPSAPGVFPAFYAGSYPRQRGYVNPIVVSPTARGMGRSFTISEMTLHMARLPDWTAPLSFGNDLGALPFKTNPSEDNKDGTAPDGIYQISLIPSLHSVMAGYSVLALSVRVTFKNIKFKVEALDSNNNPAKDLSGNDIPPYYPFQGKGTTTWENQNPLAQDFDQPTLFSNGIKPTSTSGGAPPFGFAMTYGGSIGYKGLLRVHDWLGGEPRSCPPNALVRIRNINPRTATSSTRLAISGTFDVEISSPAKNTPTNTTNEPVIQTLHFDFPRFTAPLPWCH